MALESVKGYVRSRMLSLGYTEWNDALNFENIPKTLLNEKWHISFGRAGTVTQNQTPVQLRWPFTLRLFKAPAIDTGAVFDSAVVSAEAVLRDLLAVGNKLNYDDALKNISLDSFILEQLGETNDNGVQIVLEMSALVILDID